MSTKLGAGFSGLSLHGLSSSASFSGCLWWVIGLPSLALVLCLDVARRSIRDPWRFSSSPRAR